MFVRLMAKKKRVDTTHRPPFLLDESASLWCVSSKDFPIGMGLAETNDIKPRMNVTIVNMNIMKVSVLEGRVQDQPEFALKTENNRPSDERDRPAEPGREGREGMRLAEKKNETSIRVLCIPNSRGYQKMQCPICIKQRVDTGKTANCARWTPKI
ncbi:hypothetical protein BT96DRAFT_430812 [Gymnopus androsaceus JB14]|uniref:Uncharacterized protein n=1 Tax=Gymnopus androsaceus JB14 TaxID=1447944 RepID=A0A6A4GSA1_9AGAR|nr:hypothetical protein BT96DRAFT_430812 [Gymnopus androsaceus JB14]